MQLPLAQISGAMALLIVSAAVCFSSESLTPQLSDTAGSFSLPPALSLVLTVSLPATLSCGQAGAYLNERLSSEAKARLKKNVIRYAIFALCCMVRLHLLLHLPIPRSQHSWFTEDGDVSYILCQGQDLTSSHHLNGRFRTGSHISSSANIWPPRQSLQPSTSVRGLSRRVLPLPAPASCPPMPGALRPASPCQ